MTLVVKDRVKETTTTAGTGAITLNGAAAGFQSFAVIGNGNTTYYAITEVSTAQWEVGVGTYTSSGTTLARTKVLSSSNGGAAVNFGATVKDVFVTYPALAALSTFSDRGTGVTSTYVSTVAVGGTTFAQPAVDGEIKSDQGYFSINYAGATGITVANLAAASTYVYIDNAGALQQQTTTPTRQDWSRKMFTMRIAIDLATNLILGFEYLNNPIGHYANSIRDLYSFLLANGVPFKQNQTVTGRADLGFDVGAGTLMEFGGTGDIDNANIKSFDAVANAEFFLATRTAFDAGGNTSLPKFWDNNGVLTALGSTTLVGHRLYRFSNGNFVLQYGQGNYANLTLAKSGAVLEDYVLNPQLKNATFFGWWFIESTATTTNGTTLTAFSEYTIGIQGGSSGSLAGCLLKGNNLSDLLDASAARTNLGLGTAATTAATAYATAAQGALAASATQPADLATIATTGNYANLVGTVPTWNQNTTGSSGSTTGNAATATTLQTARTINGVSFNGSANITVADATKLALTGGTMSGDLIISKADAKIRLYDSTGTTGNNPFIEWDTTATQGIKMELNVYDGELPRAGYGLVVGPSTTNNQWPDTGDLTFNVLGEIYAGSETLSGVNRVFHDSYHPNADTLTTARTISLSGDVSGSASFNGSANATITAVVADDSHNHIISNVDGLQTALDGKLSTSGKAADSDLLDGVNSSSFLRSDANDTKTGYLEMQDGSTNYIALGNGGDFRMWHDGSNTYFRNYNHPDGDMIWQTEGTGGVVHTAMIVKGDTTTPRIELYYDSAKKLETTSTGVTVTGTQVADTFSGSGSGLTTLNASNLSSGTVANARISGTYTGLTSLTGSGTVDFAKFLGNAADTAAAPSYSWTGDTNTGMYRPTTDQLGFSTVGVERVRVDNVGNLKFNSGYGSVATAYGCRAWVNFNGTGTVAIIASGNVSSITDNGNGNYFVNFTTAFSDTNYAVVASTQGAGYTVLPIASVNQGNNQTTARTNIYTTGGGGGATFDLPYIAVAVFR